MSDALHYEVTLDRDKSAEKTENMNQKRGEKRKGIKTR